MKKIGAASTTNLTAPTWTVLVVRHALQCDADRSPAPGLHAAH